MNLAELQRKLIAAARAIPLDERVPLAFEKRVMARIKSRSLADHGTLWAHALWRAAAPCLAVMLLLSAWSYYNSSSTVPADDLNQDLENTLLATIVDQDQNPDSSW
jgi:hypothetical protein